MDWEMKEQALSNPRDKDQFSLLFKMNLSSNIYQIRVSRLKHILECFAEIMGLLSGLSFISRFVKQILLDHGVGSKIDKMYIEYIENKRKLKQRQELGSSS